MNTANEISKRLLRHFERCSDANTPALSKEEEAEQEKNQEMGAEFINQMFTMPQSEALALLNKLEEQDDFIESLERAEKDLSPAMNDFQEFAQNDVDTGWCYSDIDIDDEL